MNPILLLPHNTLSLSPPQYNPHLQPPPVSVCAAARRPNQSRHLLGPFLPSIDPFLPLFSLVVPFSLSLSLLVPPSPPSSSGRCSRHPPPPMGFAATATACETRALSPLVANRDAPLTGAVIFGSSASVPCYRRHGSLRRRCSRRGHLHLKPPPPFPSPGVVVAAGWV
ncbi:hypothetical protein RIF29_00847 [Crotalaria pallida]|uniref:Uncharacterized protein n=1 Tax=Crotalaria pallida TaxID=3830 RepID=A0AAN9IWP6_CROPI